MKICRFCRKSAEKVLMHQICTCRPTGHGSRASAPARIHKGTVQGCIALPCTPCRFCTHVPICMRGSARADFASADLIENRGRMQICARKIRARKKIRSADMTNEVCILEYRMNRGGDSTLAITPWRASDTAEVTMQTMWTGGVETGGRPRLGVDGVPLRELRRQRRRLPARPPLPAAARHLAFQ
jgi:hypothetical protein